MRDVNQETINGTLSWYEILPLNGFNLIRVKTKSSHETERNLSQFLEPSQKPTVVHTDNVMEFGKACEDLSWTHRTSTPHRSETNGIAERAARRSKEGTSAVLCGRKMPLNSFPRPKKSNSNHVNNSKTARFCTFEGKVEE